jgi:hypothetical protein
MGLLNTKVFMLVDSKVTLCEYCGKIGHRKGFHVSFVCTNRKHCDFGMYHWTLMDLSDNR